MQIKNPKQRVKELSKKFFKSSNLNIVFSPFKTRNLFLSKDCLPNDLKSFVVYKFVCAGCQSGYIVETKRYLSRRINEHLVTHKKSHTFKHLLEKTACKILYDEKCFAIIDSVSLLFRLRLKDALYITWLYPYLDKQKEHASIIISV